MPYNIRIAIPDSLLHTLLLHILLHPSLATTGVGYLTRQSVVLQGLRTAGDELWSQIRRATCLARAPRDCYIQHLWRMTCF